MSSLGSTRGRRRLGSLFAERPASGLGWLIPMALVLAAIWMLPYLKRVGQRGAPAQVVAYVSLDPIVAEPILRAFEQESGIRVDTVYGGTAGTAWDLAEMLLAQRARPGADLWWSQDEFSVHRLEAEGLLRQGDPWRPAGFYSRRLVYNPERLAPTQAPRSLLELTNEAWRGKVALVHPTRGNSATHFQALRQRWGPARWEAWCAGLRANAPFLAATDAEAIRRVAAGDAWLSWVDSGAAAFERRQGSRVEILPVEPETLLISYAAGVIRGAPHPREAQLLFDHLTSPRTLRRLIQQEAIEGESADAFGSGLLRPDWEVLHQRREADLAVLKRLFPG